MFGLIDYAGLFPPAALSLEPALEEYARLRTDEDSWMLGRFVVNSAQLAAVAGRADLLPKGHPVAFAVLGRGGDGPGPFLEGFTIDLEEISRFRKQLGGGVTVDQFEVKMPARLLDSSDGEATSMFFDDVARWADAEGPPELTPFFEAPAGGDRRARWSFLIDSIAAHNARRSAPGVEGGGRRLCPAGIKLRCGGADARAFPSVEEVAFVLARCAERKVAFKATAGLHHPVRYEDAVLRTKVHGFINVFGAAHLAFARGLGEKALRPILEEEDLGKFGFDARRFVWNGTEVSFEEIESLRHAFVTSFGSCSFAEPLADLRACGWLERRSLDLAETTIPEQPRPRK